MNIPRLVAEHTPGRLAELRAERESLVRALAQIVAAEAQLSVLLQWLEATGQPVSEEE